MRHYCRTCNSASVFRETDEGKHSFFCGKAGCWVTAKSADGIMDNCTGWSWKGLQTLYIILSIGMLVICVSVMITIVVCNILMVVNAA